MTMLPDDCKQLGTIKGAKQYLDKFPISLGYEGHQTAAIVDSQRCHTGIAETNRSEAHGSPGAETFQSASPQIMQQLKRSPAHGQAGELV